MQVAVENNIKERIWQDYIKEKKQRFFLQKISQTMVFSSAIVFLYLLFSGHYTADPRIAILAYWGLFTNLSSVILIPYFQIPMLILNLNHFDKDIARLSYEVIDANRLNVLNPILMESRKFIDEGVVLSWNSEDIISQFGLRDRIDWKKIGKYYFPFYCIVSVILIYFFFLGLFA